MTTKTDTNGQVRKTLATQLDRLDGILDGLGNGLNEAVAEAVKGAVGTAVKEALHAVLTEVLTNPALMEHLQPPASPIPEPLPNPPSPDDSTRPTSLLGRLRSAGAALGERVRRASTWARRRLTTVLLVGAGVVAAAATFFFRPKLALLVGWVAGNVTALAARLGLRGVAASTTVT